MNTKRYIEKNTLYAKLFILTGGVGISGLIITYLMGIGNGGLTGVFSGLTFGFLPTGVGMLFTLNKSKNNQCMQRNIQIETEERNIFINTKSGYGAFWISYFLLFVFTMLNNIVDISFRQFSIIFLIFMPVVYFSLIVINHRRY